MAKRILAYLVDFVLHKPTPVTPTRSILITCAGRTAVLEVAA